LQRHWRGSGLPLLLIPVEEGPFQRSPETFLRLGETLRNGVLGGTAVQLGSLDDLASQACWADLPSHQPEAATSTPAEPTQGLQSSNLDKPLTAADEQELELRHLDALLERLWQSGSLQEHAELLELLVRRLGLSTVLTGPSGNATPKALLEEAYRRGLKEGDWNVVRRCAGVLGLVHPQLEDALTDLLVRQKQLVVGRNYTNDSLITQPLSSKAIAARIRRYSGEDSREWVLQQELLLALDGLARRDPALLSGSLTLQLGQLLLLLTSEVAGEQNLSPSDAFEALCDTPPHTIGRRLKQVLSDVEHAKAALQRKEQLHLSGRVSWEAPAPLEELEKGENWLKHRERMGALQNVPRDFHPGIWSLLHHCRGLVIGDKLERRNRLESAPLLKEKTPGERNFAVHVEHLLSKIEAPEYRRLCIETLVTLIAFVDANPEIQFEDDLVLDVVIGHAVKTGWEATSHTQAERPYDLDKAQAWSNFYNSSPAACREWQIAALKRLSEAGDRAPAEQE